MLKILDLKMLHKCLFSEIFSKLVSFKYKGYLFIIDMKRQIVRVGNVEVGGEKIVLIAGPCSIDNEKFLLKTAIEIKQAGATVLRGDAFKARTFPNSFQGLGLEGLKILKRVKEVAGIPVITEVMDTRDVMLVSEYADILKVGARNMQNFSLLKEVGKCDKPVMLKRGFGNKISELLGAVKYIQEGGNKNIILCERGIRSFEDSTRFTLDISAIPLLKKLTNLPVIADPSHATGKADMIEPISLACIAAGADGLMMEVHTNPENALSDKDQTISTASLKELSKKIKLMAPIVGRKFG